jgi:hypothetical protein
MTLTEAQRKAIIKAWLLSKGITLWADWDIQTKDGLEDAAEWFHSQSLSFSKFFSDYVEESTH